MTLHVKKSQSATVYTGWSKNVTILYVSTLPNINRFSKLFHSQNQEKICNNTITEDPTTPQVCFVPFLEATLYAGFMRLSAKMQ